MRLRTEQFQEREKGNLFPHFSCIWRHKQPYFMIIISKDSLAAENKSKQVCAAYLGTIPSSLLLVKLFPAQSKEHKGNPAYAKSCDSFLESHTECGRGVWLLSTWLIDQPSAETNTIIYHEVISDEHMRAELMIYCINIHLTLSVVCLRSHSAGFRVTTDICHQYHPVLHSFSYLLNHSCILFCRTSTATSGVKNIAIADFRFANHKLVFLFLFPYLCREKGHWVTPLNECANHNVTVSAF